MKELVLNGTKQTPSVNFNAVSGMLELSGRSIPENSFEFYNPLIEWLNEYTTVALDLTKIKVYLEYFNTSSSKYILEVLKKLKEINEIAGKEVSVEWCYDEGDDEMMETGEDYEDVTGLQFTYTEMEE
ncbi:MAG TPA: nuclear pore complex subunit [Bacteroidales bacterium]|nr:nuclear pore complex subunit [Bacteroidales bacterium]